MQKFKAVATSRLALFIGGVVLAVGVAWPLMGAAQDKSNTAKDPNQHAQHKDTQPGGDQDLASQIAELRDSVARLEATLAKGQLNIPSGMGRMGQAKSGMQGGKGMAQGGGGMGGGEMPMNGKSGMGSSTKPMQGGMGGSASPPDGEMGMMSMKMDKMMGMMAKMMGGMTGGATPAGASMGGAAPGGTMMDDDQMEMGGMGGGAPATGAPMAGGGMGGKGASSMGMPSALPGFPGASHLYHVGATGFFLDHPQHIALSTEQQMMLNQIKEQVALDKATTGRIIQEAEQALWTLTAADQPDNAQVEAKVAEIEKLSGDARLRFIGAVGRAAAILNDEQRNILTGFAPPVSAAPAAAPMAGGMNDM